MPITAKNYVAKAIKDLRQLSIRVTQKFSKREHPLSVLDLAMMECMTKEMSACPHFALPDGRKLLGDDLKGLKGLKARLPYKKMTIEYYSGGEMPEEEKFDKQTGRPRILVDRRVLFVEERTAEDQEFLQKTAMEKLAGICPELVLATKEAAKAMEPNTINVYLFSSGPQTRNTFVMHPIAAMIPFDWEDAIGKHAPAGTVAFAGRVVLPWMFLGGTVGGMSTKDSWRVAMEDLADEVGAVLALCEALACSNVSAENLEEPLSPNENRKRIASGRLPIYETKVLVVSVPVNRTTKAEGTGTHASPREHLRRGHIRVLHRGEPGEERIWVNSCIVNPGGPGRIDKSYQIIGQDD